MYFVQFSLPPQGRLPGLSGHFPNGIANDFQSVHYRSFTASPTIKDYFEVLLAEQRKFARVSVMYEVSCPPYI
jgi:hypothetical protein